MPGFLKKVVLYTYGDGLPDPDDQCRDDYRTVIHALSGSRPVLRPWPGERPTTSKQPELMLNIATEHTAPMF
jgi:hypothetical protein